jgi:hypothetical protein
VATSLAPFLLVQWSTTLSDGRDFAIREVIVIATVIVSAVNEALFL